MFVIVNTRSPAGDGFLQRFVDFFMKECETCGAHSNRPAARIDSGAVEAFVRVNIADTGDNCLVEQKGFQNTRALFEEAHKITRWKFKRVGR